MSSCSVASLSFKRPCTCLLTVVHHTSGKTSSSSCMVDRLSAAGIPSSQIADYNAKLSARQIKIVSLEHLSPIVFRLLGITSLL